MNNGQANRYIIFDSNCLLCNSFIRKILKQNRTITIVASKSSMGISLAKEFGIDIHTLNESIYLIDKEYVYSKLEAIRRIYYLMGGRFIVYSNLLKLIPLPLKEKTYDLIAKNRYFISQYSNCQLLSPEEREKVIIK